jgi:hypothetical protein
MSNKSIVGALVGSSLTLFKIGVEDLEKCNLKYN